MLVKNLKKILTKKQMGYIHRFIKDGKLADKIAERNRIKTGVSLNFPQKAAVMAMIRKRRKFYLKAKQFGFKRKQRLRLHKIVQNDPEFMYDFRKSSFKKILKKIKLEDKQKELRKYFR